MKDLLSLAFVGLLDGAGFALLGESLFSVAKKVTKNACPCIRPRLRRGSFAPSPLRRPSYKSHPWPFTTLAASLRLALYATIPLTLLKGAVGVACWFVQKEAKPKQHQQSFKRLGPHPPSGGRVEVLRRGTRGMDAERGAKGQGRPFVTAPGAAPERGNPGVAGAGCRARFLFGYFLFRASKEKVTRPRGRNQKCQHTR